MHDAVPIPTLRGEETTFFREAAAGRLTYQRCSGCSAAVFYQRTVCPTCLSDELVESTSVGHGTVYSYTIVHRSGHPWFTEADVPYAVALVDVSEGFRVLANIRDCAPAEVTIGMEVEVLFDRITEEFGVPHFRPVRIGAES